MTIRNLDALFKPASIALIGASPRPGSVGAVIAHNLFDGGFAGPVMPVNPNHKAVEGVLTYRDIGSLPMAPDLAVIATPPGTVPGLIAELGAAGTRGVVVITAGFGESRDARGKALQQRALDAARPHLLRIIGPNCLGIMVPGLGINAGFGPVAPLPGKLAFVAQSGAVIASIADWATSRDIGFSHMASLGDMADVDFGDMLDYLANDPGTSAILLYIENVTHARKFMSAARAAARTKPVVVVKAGRHAEGARAAASHTGALSGSDAVCDAAFRRAGMLRVLSLEELFDAVQTLAAVPPPRGDRLAILTNGGGMGVLATDAAIDRGGRLAALGGDTMARLDAVLPDTWSRDNPVDIIGDAPGDRYRESLAALLADPGVDGVVVLNCPTGIASSTEAADAVIGVCGKRPPKPVLSSWVGGGSTDAARARLSAARLATYDTPTQAVRAFMHLVEFRRNQDMLMETPPSSPTSFTPDEAAARAVIARALAAGREWLSEGEAKAVMAAYGVPVVPTREVDSPDAAAEAAAGFGEPVALKIRSADLTHKSDIGGVVLDLRQPEEVRQAAEAMLAGISAAAPRARIDGFTVQPMVHRPGAVELIVGMSVDPQFGPSILFGQGGTAVEVLKDTAVALPPLNLHLASDLVSRTRVAALLAGYRDRPAANREAIHLALVKVAQLAMDIAQIVELDINPLLADADGVVALDARIRVAATDADPVARLAIRPYPKALEETVALVDGRTLMLRPIVPEDEPALRAGFEQLTPEEIRLRFLAPMKSLTHIMAARFTQLDYDREMALVLGEAGIPGKAALYGVVRISADPDLEKAEYAIVLRGDIVGRGLGRLMLERIIAYARSRGIGMIYGDVLHENSRMLKLCKALGFARRIHPEDSTLVRVELPLHDTGARATA
jgi:acetyltransferase